LILRIEQHRDSVAAGVHHDQIGLAVAVDIGGGDGETLVYTAILSNSGSAAATNVGIDFGLSAGLDAVNATWSCSAAGGASCPASSSASMTVPSLPIGGTLTWTPHVTVLTTTPDPTVTVQVSLNGTMQATNTAILVIFRNGFD
jgi:uncharacterized repeat protein (TIGR01451 family)